MGKHTFADRIIAKYTQFGIYRDRDADLVFFVPDRRRESGKKESSPAPAASSYGLLFRFYMTWQNYRKNDRDYKEYAVFRNVASIFENKSSRPDAAKKAERELLRMLSSDFYEELIFRRERRERTAGPKKQAAGGDESRSAAFARAQIRQTQSWKEELGSTKHMVGVLEERVKLQETILTELRRKIVTAASVPDADIKKITGEVVKQMEREMHLERLRRGL